jgi:hypothetical protein
VEMDPNLVIVIDLEDPLHMKLFKGSGRAEQFSTWLPQI